MLASGLRLDDVGPSISYDDAWAFLKALSHDKTSAVYRVLHGHNWGQSEILQAQTFDRLGQLGGVIVAVNGGRPRKLDLYPLPKPLRGDGRTDTRTRGEALPIADVLAWAAESEGAADG